MPRKQIAREPVPTRDMEMVGHLPQTHQPPRPRHPSKDSNRTMISAEEQKAFTSLPRAEREERELTRRPYDPLTVDDRQSLWSQPQRGNQETTWSSSAYSNTPNETIASSQQSVETINSELEANVDIPALQRVRRAPPSPKINGAELQQATMGVFDYPISPLRDDIPETPRVRT
ncbi:hypothetical protein G7Y89_g572 [Cudoniella acicularis]|uniref:Uncharacterized protein n=1 Tax=Cudoniella acicularis TaxID=354080 RepID=A0A8H4RWX5_9HELO|nr:hypothetical protein G7Y89_g572 [Cudoniella acicularis]